MNEKQNSRSNPSETDKKRLFILERLKEEWDLAPKKNSGPMMVQGGLVAFRQRAHATRISWRTHIQWQQQCGIDYYQLKNILQGFQDDGLLESFEFINPAR